MDAEHAVRRMLAPALLVLFAAAAGPAAAQGLEALLPPPAPAPYRGRKVVVDFTRRGPHVSSMSVVCQPGGGERRELHATRALFVADGQSAWQYLPERGVVLKRPAHGDGVELLRPEQVRRALSSYSVRLVASGRVAGRRARALEFLPRQTGSRPRRMVWVDDETGLVLRSEVYGTDSRLLWLSAFEELEYRPPLGGESFAMKVPAGVRVVESRAERCLEPPEAERLAGVPVALPGYLPEGFERQCIRARREGQYGEVQAVFGDGLTLLSLFASTSFREQDPGAAAGAVEVGPAAGRWHDLGLVTGISWRAPWAYMALLGELSREEMHKIAGSVRGPRELTAPARGR